MDNIETRLNRPAFPSNNSNFTDSSQPEASAPSPIPSLSLPRGGGAIRGIGEKFGGLLDASDVWELSCEPGLMDDQTRALLLDGAVLPTGLTADEERKACRALKGSMLLHLQEVYAQNGRDEAQHPFPVTEQHFDPRVLRPRGSNRQGVLLNHAPQSISHHCKPKPATLRIGCALTLEVDQFGKVLNCAAIGYGRRQLDPNLSLADQAEQAQILINYTERTGSPRRSILPTFTARRCRASRAPTS